MPMFYRGVTMQRAYRPVDHRLEGFVARRPGATPTIDMLLSHVANGATNSPFISLTRSFGIAKRYAMHGPQKRGWVYSIEIDESHNVEVLDPLKETGQYLPEPLKDPSYQHDGAPDFILGVADPHRHWKELNRPIDLPPPGYGTPRPAHLHRHLEVMVRSLRDSELLAITAIPAKLVVDRQELS